jgi:hypothetical protein
LPDTSPYLDLSAQRQESAMSRRIQIGRRRGFSRPGSGRPYGTRSAKPTDLNRSCCKRFTLLTTDEGSSSGATFPYISHAGSAEGSRASLGEAGPVPVR